MANQQNDPTTPCGKIGTGTFFPHGPAPYAAAGENSACHFFPTRTATGGTGIRMTREDP